MKEKLKVTMKYLLILSSLFVAVGSLHFDFNDDISQYKLDPISKTHPMLYYGPKDVERLRSVASTSHKEIVLKLQECLQTIRRFNLWPPKDFKTFEGRWNEMYGNNLPPLAMLYVLQPNEKLFKELVTYMDTMASYPKWWVAGMPFDEVPLSHCLMGFLTAYDMLHDKFDEHRRKVYIDKIINMTREMYTYAVVPPVRWWTTTYLQNHVASNTVAYFMGAIISHVHTPEALTWKKHGLMAIQRNMQLLAHVKDGSHDEGIPYAGYTTRSWTQYAFLTMRHMGVDMTDSMWWKKHFDYMYYSIVPGLKYTVGIADSGKSWWYGPESQLRFWDTYILKNGSGNWLADNIRKNRDKEITVAQSQLYCTLHTEYIWYNPSLKPVPPKNYDKTSYFVFEDWGVVLYRDGSLMKRNASSYFSFKSGKLRGAAMFEIGTRLPMAKASIEAFNSGHEHPDQNSFTFAIDGKYLVSEGLYNSKDPIMDNILMFAPSPTETCNGRWAGMRGDCVHWLGYKTVEEATSYGQIVATGMKNKIVFASGESVNAYRTNLGLKSVYRGTILLNAQLLLVIDHVERLPSSPIKYVGANFNNIYAQFKDWTGPTGKRGARILHSDKKDYSMLWFDQDYVSPKASMRNYTGTFANGISLNVTFPMKEQKKHLTYLIFGPKISVKKASFNKSSKGDTVIVDIYTNVGGYSVTFNGNYMEVYKNAQKSFCTVKQYKEQSKEAVQTTDFGSEFAFKFMNPLWNNSKSKTETPQKTSTAKPKTLVKDSDKKTFNTDTSQKELFKKLNLDIKQSDTEKKTTKIPDKTVLKYDPIEKSKMPIVPEKESLAIWKNRKPKSDYVIVKSDEDFVDHSLTKANSNNFILSNITLAIILVLSVYLGYKFFCKRKCWLFGAMKRHL